MIIVSREIRERIKNGEQIFSPALSADQWGEASVDLRIGFAFTKLEAQAGVRFSVSEGIASVAKSGFWNTRQLRECDEHGKPERYSLDPGDFVLALTHERISMPRDLIGLVEGRSTYARVGLAMHQTAPWIQPGWSGHITLEIRNSGPFTIDLQPLVDRPCQLTFLRLSAPLTESEAYGAQDGGRYQGQTSVLPEDEPSSRS